MREYGQIQCSFWTNPDMQEFSDYGKLLSVYLLTGPHSNGLGCYRLPIGYVQADFGWTKERVTQTLSELSGKGFIQHCKKTNFVLIPKYLRWNKIQNANVAKARQDEFQSISKKTIFYSDLCKCILKYGNHLSDPFETLLKRYSKQDPTQPYPTRPDPKTTEHATNEQKTVTASQTENQDFESLWMKYPERAGGNPKRDALIAFNATIKRGKDLIDIEAGLDRYIQFCVVTGKIQTEHVLQARTFFGPSERWKESWTLPRSGAALSNSNDAAISKALGGMA